MNVTGTPCAASAPPSRSFLWAPQDAGWVTAMRAADPPSRCAARSTTQRTSLADSSSGAHGRPATRIGGGVPALAVDPAPHLVRVAPPPPFGCLADDHRAVVADVEHGGNGAGAVAEVDDLGITRARTRPTDCGGGAGGAHIDAEQIAHRHPSSCPNDPVCPSTRVPITLAACVRTDHAGIDPSVTSVVMLWRSQPVLQRL